MKMGIRCPYVDIGLRKCQSEKYIYSDSNRFMYWFGKKSVILKDKYDQLKVEISGRLFRKFLMFPSRRCKLY